MNKVINNYRCGLLIMVALVFLSISCYGKTNNRKDHELRGPVCAVVVKDIKFSIRLGEVAPTGESNDTLYYFHKNGNVYMEEYASIYTDMFYYICGEDDARKAARDQYLAVLSDTTGYEAEYLLRILRKVKMVSDMN